MTNIRFNSPEYNYSVYLLRGTLSPEPFITFVTRYFIKRNRVHFRNNLRSVRTQTDHDYEQLIIIDHMGVPIGSKHQFTARPTIFTRNMVNGKYIMILDDDDIIIDKYFIEKIKKVVADNNEPDALIWRGRIQNWSEPLPCFDRPYWNKEPERSQIGSFCFCMKRVLWQQYIPKYLEGKDLGDWLLIHHVYEQKHRIVWINEVFFSTQAKGFGR